MENEATAQNDTTETAANGSHGRPPEETVEPRQPASRPVVAYLTDEEADQAAEEVFRFHRRLLAELAK